MTGGPLGPRDGVGPRDQVGAPDRAGAARMVDDEMLPVEGGEARPVGVRGGAPLRDGHGAADEKEAEAARGALPTRSLGEAGAPAAARWDAPGVDDETPVTAEGVLGSAPAIRQPRFAPPVRDWIAPLVSLTGLAVVGWLTLGFVSGDLRVPGTGGINGPPGGAGGRTPAPSNVVIVDPRADVPGSIVYVKSGNVWIQSGASVRQLTRTGTASNPSWSADGQWIVYIETSEENGLYPSRGSVRRYVMLVPTLMRVRADGTGEPEALASGLIEQGRFRWFYWIRQPVLSPDGKTVAVISDGPDPTKSNMVLQLVDAASGKFRRANVPENEPLGHQDPAWRPDGQLLLIVRNGEETGGRGSPAILRYNPATNRAGAFTGPGYLSPSWSRDVRWVAATRTTGLATDVVVLDARNGAEVFRVTTDGRSFSPVWSPAGDGIAFLHEVGGIVDLRLARLEGDAPAWTVSDTINLTEVSGLDAASRPGWFIPPQDLPALPTPQPSVPSPATSAGGGASSPSGAP